MEKSRNAIRRGNREILGDIPANFLERREYDLAQQEKRNSRRDGGKLDYVYDDTNPNDFLPIHTILNPEDTRFFSSSQLMNVPNVRVNAENGNALNRKTNQRGELLPAAYVYNDQKIFTIPPRAPNNGEILPEGIFVINPDNNQVIDRPIANTGDFFRTPVRNINGLFPRR